MAAPTPASPKIRLGAAMTRLVGLSHAGADAARSPGCQTGLADSALEHAELMAGGEHLGTGLGVRVGADEREVSDEPDGW